MWKNVLSNHENLGFLANLGDFFNFWSQSRQKNLKKMKNSKICFLQIFCISFDYKLGQNNRANRLKLCFESPFFSYFALYFHRISRKIARSSLAATVIKLQWGKLEGVWAHFWIFITRVQHMFKQRNSKLRPPPFLSPEGEGGVKLEMLTFAE